MKHHIGRLGFLLLVASSIHCETTPSEPDSCSRPPAKSRQELAAESPLVGYDHDPSNSLFFFGSLVHEKTEFGFRKFVGEQGTIAVDLYNRSVQSSSNAGSPRLAMKPYGTTGKEHDDRVRSYFVSNGLPANQVRAVQTHTLMAGSGPATTGDPNLGAGDALAAYYSVLTRATPGGIPISDSYAWARFDVEGRVVSEAVYWPEIQGAVLQDALALREVLAHPAKGAAYKTKLPLADDGVVVIRHTSSAYRGAFEARSVYEVSSGPTIRDFDLNAEEVTLAEARVTISQGGGK